MAKQTVLERLLANWKRGHFGRHSLWDGEEDLLKERALSGLISFLFPAGNREFNFDPLDANQCNPADIMTAVQTLPFIADKRFVLVKNADSLTSSEEKLVAESLDSVPASTCLVFLYTGRSKKTQPLAKKVEEVVTFWPLFDDQLPVWIMGEVKRFGKSMDMTAAQCLADRLSGNLREVAQEIEKIATYVGSGARIRLQDVESALFGTYSTRPFGLDHAVWRRELSDSLEMTQKRITQGEAPELVWRSLVRAWRSLVNYHATGTSVPHPSARAALMISRRVWQKNDLMKGLETLFYWELEYKSGRVEPNQAISFALIEVMGKPIQNTLN